MFCGSVCESVTAFKFAFQIWIGLRCGFSRLRAFKRDWEKGLRYFLNLFILLLLLEQVKPMSKHLTALFCCVSSINMGQVIWSQVIWFCFSTNRGQQISTAQCQLTTRCQKLPSSLYCFFIILTLHIDHLYIQIFLQILCLLYQFCLSYLYFICVLLWLYFYKLMKMFQPKQLH